MNINDNIINNLIQLSTEFVDTTLSKYNYNDEIKNILYLVIPTFIVKYGYDNKNKILKVFEEVPIIINNKDDKILQAFYTSIPFKDNENIYTKKFIVVNNYHNKSLLELIDNIIHEYNHATNSLIKEIKEDDNFIFLRTGLTYSKYNKTDSKNNYKDDSYILEEIINTKQTEQLIEIINSFSKYEINNEKIKTIMDRILPYINKGYESEAYLLQSTLCKELMNNKVFISVLSSFRFTGNVDEIEEFFDNITGIDNSYKRIIQLLIQSVKLEEELNKSKLFKKQKIIKLNKIYLEARSIIETFNYNYHF